MERTYIKDAKSGEKIKICGFIENLRDKKSMQFIVLKDTTGKMQITVEKEKLPEIAEIFSSLIVGCVVSIEGTVVDNEYVKLGGKELLPEKVEVLSRAEALPINDQAQIEERLNYRWIDLRDEKKALVFKIATDVEMWMREYCVSHNFMEIHTPKITYQSTEGGAEVFCLDYFGQKAYLTQSPQFYKQMAMSSGFEKVFEFGDCFRAEQSFTARHATEFESFDVEMSYIDSHYDVMAMEEDLIKYVLKNVSEKYAEQIESTFGVKVNVPAVDFPKIKYHDALEILKSEYNYVGAANDFDTESERLICDYVLKKFGSEFVFIVDFPTNQRAFYSMKYEDKPELCKSYDLLWKDQEITSGAQREHRWEELTKNIAGKGIKPENMQGYIDFFKYGCPPHGGYAIGMARFITKLLGLSSIKEATFLFRGPNRLLP
ncbi:MAG: aspartate--tRNA(Asn) ligase [Clostridiales bacterium]|nr:aspartate--tRNA(Asn) ligase [Candidatus Apopatousia equi]